MPAGVSATKTATFGSPLDLADVAPLVASAPPVIGQPELRLGRYLACRA